MKRIVLALFIFCGMFFTDQSVYAFSFAAKKAEIIHNFENKHDIQAIKKVLNQQEKYAAKYDARGLATLYHKSFISADGKAVELLVTYTY